MTFGQLLSELAQNRIGITITGNSIKTNVPAGNIPDHIKEAMRLNKDVIIATFNKPLKTFDNAESLEETAVALGGVIAGQYDPDKIPGEVVLEIREWLTNPDVKIICEGDEFGF